MSYPQFATTRLPRRLFAEMHRLAAEDEMTVSEWVRAAIRHEVARRRQRQNRSRPEGTSEQQ